MRLLVAPVFWSSVNTLIRFPANPLPLVGFLNPRSTHHYAATRLQRHTRAALRHARMQARRGTQRHTHTNMNAQLARHTNVQAPTQCTQTRGHACMNALSIGVEDRTCCVVIKGAGMPQGCWMLSSGRPPQGRAPRWIACRAASSCTCRLVRPRCWRTASSNRFDSCLCYHTIFEVPWGIFLLTFLHMSMCVSFGVHWLKCELVRHGLGAFSLCFLGWYT